MLGGVLKKFVETHLELPKLSRPADTCRTLAIGLDLLNPSPKLRTWISTKKTLESYQRPTSILLFSPDLIKLCGQCPRPRMIWAERDVSERRRVSQRRNRSSVKNIGPTSHILRQTHISRRVSVGDPNLAINHFSPSMKSCIMQQPRPQGAEFVFVAPGPQRAGESQSTCSSGNFRCRPLRCRWLVCWLRKRLPGAVSAGGVSSVLEFWLECMVLIVD